MKQASSLSLVPACHHKRNLKLPRVVRKQLGNRSFPLVGATIQSLSSPEVNEIVLRGSMDQILFPEISKGHRYLSCLRSLSSVV